MEHMLAGFIEKAKPRCAVFVLMFADIIALVSAVLISLLLRFDGYPWSRIYDLHIHNHKLSLLVSACLYLVSFTMFRLYRYAWRFASIEMLWAIVYSNSVGLVGLIVAQLFIDGTTMPRSVLIILWTTSIVLIGSVRIILRMLSIAHQHGRRSLQVIRRDIPQRRAVLLGAGSDGARTLRTVREGPSLRYDVIGILDDNPSKHGTYIHNVRVMGPLGLLPYLIAENSIDEVIVALPEDSGHKIREYVLECRKQKIPVKVIPQLHDVLAGKSFNQLMDFSVEDLLRRPSANLETENIGSYLTGRRVLVTGAGGSIGSELCRQIASMNPSSLVLLGHGENSIHKIHQELRRDYPHLTENINYAIASVSHKCRISQVFDQFKPQVVFHAAAHKHVPMMETNEQEAIHNNVIGTNQVVEACGLHGVERIVLISTDKAADPSCIMGATKWLCEEIARAASSLWPKTSFVSVRFGNVLGSRGSVVPMFREQIKCGGPVTVTHPEMTRYFMTIPEAVRLVLQAGAVGKTGALYLLDMGNPVKIVDLAKDMITLCGFNPEVDIEIEFTGVRPGEKLHEKLIASDEHISKTPWEGLSIVNRPERYQASEIIDAVRQLENAAQHCNAAEVRHIMNEVISGAHKPTDMLYIEEDDMSEIDTEEAEAYK